MQVEQLRMMIRHKYAREIEWTHWYTKSTNYGCRVHDHVFRSYGCALNE